MKIAVIGHYCIDVFHRSDGTEEERHGGIFHSAAAFANLATDRDTIIPVFGAGEKEIEEIKNALSRYKNIDLSGIFQYSGETNRVHYYDDQPNERLLNIAEPIPFSHVKKFLSVDGVYVNMISGRDLTVDTIDEIRLAIRKKKTPIHLDLHCLTLHVHENGSRSFRPMADWRRWCFMTDSVQMNEEEAAEMSVEHFNDELLAKQMIPLMVKAFIITRGANGATVYQEEHKHLLTTQIPGEPQTKTVSVLGSGDIFGAAFFFACLKKKSYVDAAQFANRAASMSTQYSVSEKYEQLTSMREQL